MKIPSNKRTLTREKEARALTPEIHLDDFARKVLSLSLSTNKDLYCAVDALNSNQSVCAGKRSALESRFARR